MRFPVLLALSLAIAPTMLRAQGPTLPLGDTTTVGVRMPDYGAAAQVTRNHLYDKWQFNVSAAALIISTTVRVDPDSGEGTELNSEDDLGLANVVLRPRLAARWRPGARHELELSWVFVKRSGERTLEDEFEVGDTTFSAGARIGTSIRNDQIGLVYRYALHSSETSQLGLGVGLGAQIFHFEFDAIAGAASGGDTTIVEGSAKKKLIGPTGSLGVYGRWQLSPAWNIEADLRGIYAKISTVTVWDLELGGNVRYWLSDTWGLEAGYGLGLYDVNVEVSNDGSLLNYDFAGKIRYSNQNLRFGVNIAL
ncbi:MAG: hypothetical protein ACJ8AU_05025 [Gemmatimonadales bacterium]